MSKRSVIKFLISIGVCLLTSFVASVAISTSYDTWYAELEKPVFLAPEWLFTPVFYIFYVLIGIAAGIVWNKGFYHKWVQVALYHFGFQLILNAFWFLLFFGMQQPSWALLDSVALFILVLVTIKWFRIVDDTAAYLLYPYAAWIIYLAALNFELWRLN